MLRLGLTGSIATGKSTVLEAFSALGVPVFSADAAVHALYAEPDGAAAQALSARFPDAVAAGIVDRARLSATIAADPARLKDLEAIIHPLVRARIAAFLEDAAEKDASLAVVEVPLLFETGHDYGFDAVLVVTCREPLQRARALARPGMTVEKLDTLLARQMPQAEKIARADHRIDTSGPLETTRADVRALATALQAKRAQQQ